MKTISILAALCVGTAAYAGCASTPARTAVLHQSLDPATPRISGGIDLHRVPDHEIQMLQRAGGVRSSVRVCIAPDGSVTAAELVTPSGLKHYDAAVTANVRAWKYRPYTARKDMRVCKTVRIDYDATRDS